MSIEGTANTEYASLSGKIRTFVIDKSLSISGACADAKATGDAIETKAGEAAKNAVSEQLPAAVTAGVIAELPKFLDATLTKTDKAAQAAAVGEMDTVLRGLIGERAQIVKGSYVGTGTFGENNPNTLTFDFEPKFVFITNGAYFGPCMLAVRDNPVGYVLSFLNNNPATCYRNNLQWVEKNLSWWYGEQNGQGYTPQCNESGKTYHYIAIG